MLKVVFITQGYPSEKHPHRGIFLHRSIKVLSGQIEPFVIHLRTWTPGRQLVGTRSWEGIPLLTLSLPQVPISWLKFYNIRLLAGLGFRLALPYLKSVQLIHTANFFPSGYIGSQWSRKLNVPHVSQAIGSDIHKFLQGSDKHLAGQAWLEQMDGVGCNSEELLNQVKLLVPGLPNLKLTHRGVDTDFFHPEGAAAGPQVGQPTVRFLYLGGFQTWDPQTFEKDNFKGGALLLRTWQEAESSLGSSSLLIGGPGSSISNLEKWRMKLKRPQAVFFKEATQPAEVAGLIRASDVVLIPSYAEGLPNLANEAQACGRPVVGSQAGGIPESVLNGQTGLIFPTGDLNAFKQSLLWCWENQNQLVGLGVNGRKHIQKNFTWDAYSRTVLELYAAAVEHHAHRNNL